MGTSSTERARFLLFEIGEPVECGQQADHKSEMQNLAWTGASLLKKQPCIPRPLGSGESVPDCVHVYALLVMCRIGEVLRFLSPMTSTAAKIMPRPMIAACFREIFSIANFDASLGCTVNRKIRAAC
jgi:hypothetical protein